MATKSISKDEALRLCETIRRENEAKRISLWKIQCVFCQRFAGGDPGKLCYAANERNRGCPQVNKRYDAGE
jgi:hypothetical protein